MVRIVQGLLLIAGLLTIELTRGQALLTNNKDSVTRLFRIYEDDDYINFWGHGTDNAYTNGTRLDYFYQPAHPPHGILGKFAPRAGYGSIDVYSWGLYEIMYTPNDLTRTAWQANDYQYAGAIVAAHSRHSYNPEKKYSLQTELVFGLIGPSALAQPIQSGFHRLIHYTQPMGWSHQFRNDALVNINITAEKQLATAGNWLTLVGGARAYAGTMENGAALYPMLLIGKMEHWFDGLFNHYTSPGRDRQGRKNWQGYFVFKPQLQYFAQNAMLEGGMFTHTPDPAPPLETWVSSFAYGFVFSQGRFGFSMMQNVSSSTLRHAYCHDVGNISLYFGW
jgi:hypothetical protein